MLLVIRKRLRCLRALWPSCPTPRVWSRSRSHCVRSPRPSATIPARTIGQTSRRRARGCCCNKEGSRRRVGPLGKAAVGIEFRSERSVPALEGVLADPDLGLLARRWLAESQLRSGQVTNAVETLNAGIAVAPRSDRLMRPLYRLRLALGEREAAVALLEGMVQSRIAAIDDRIVLARLYARDENRIEDALVVLDGGLDQRDLGALAAARAWA